jgi:uncharacterized repeat protein (TIGR01451 family)
MIAPRRFLLLAATAFLPGLLGAHADTCPTLTTKTSIRKALAGGKTATLTAKVTNKGMAAVTNAGLALVLPSGVTYSSVKVTPKPATAPTLVQDGALVAWVGLSVGAKKTLTARVKLNADTCAGGDAVPPKTANGKATGLYEATIGVTTFTGTDPEGTCVSPPMAVQVCERQLEGRAGKGLVDARTEGGLVIPHEALNPLACFFFPPFHPHKSQTTVRRPKNANCLPPPQPPPPQGLCSSPEDGGFLCGTW